MAHITLTLGGGARVYNLSYEPESKHWQVRLQVWNGVEYPQSRGFHIIADSTELLCSNVFHWMGITAPYAPMSEELEGTFAVRIERYDCASTKAVEETIIHAAKLMGTGGDLYDIALHCEAEAVKASTPKASSK